MDGYWFKSTLFEAQPGEDNEANPQCYGKQLAIWIKEKFTSLGYKTSEIIPEDWGWCVAVSNDAYMLWVGCSSMIDKNGPDDSQTVPKPNEIIWHCFPVVEISTLDLKSNFKKLFGKLDTKTPLEKLDQQLLSTLSNEPSIELLENYDV